MNELSQYYLEFASSITFFEFNQKEFNDPHFKNQKYLFEINKIIEKSHWTIEELSLFLKQYPKSYDIFQEIFQLQRFTNTQLTHFLFDVSILNNINKKIILKYLEHNLKNDTLFYNIFIEKIKECSEIKFRKIEDIYDYINSEKYNSNNNNDIIFLLKLTVQEYINKASKKDSSSKYYEIIHNRIKNNKMPEVSDRIASYFINNLKFNEIKNGIHLNQFLMSKRVPIDTKSIHGNYGKNKILKIISDNGFVEMNQTSNKTLDETESKFSYIPEKKIDGITKKDEKEKKFDFVLYYDLKPKVLIETNFYSTTGTKIGINDDEYTYLDDKIKHEYPYLKFIWITDGNFWLTSGGKTKFLKLYNIFENRILNYALFEKELINIKKNMAE